MKAHLSQTRISPKKANLVASLVRNKNAQEALDILKFTPKKSAPVLRKLIKSALANAEANFKQNPENLFIKQIIVNEGTTYKRRVSISKGRMHPILKRTSHITVQLAEISQSAEISRSEISTKKASKSAQQTETEQSEVSSKKRKPKTTRNSKAISASKKPNK